MTGRILHRVGPHDALLVLAGNDGEDREDDFLPKDRTYILTENVSENAGAPEVGFTGEELNDLFAWWQREQLRGMGIAHLAEPDEWDAGDFHAVWWHDEPDERPDGEVQDLFTLFRRAEGMGLYVDDLRHLAQRAKEEGKYGEDGDELVNPADVRFVNNVIQRALAKGWHVYDSDTRTIFMAPRDDLHCDECAPSAGQLFEDDARETPCMAHTRKILARPPWYNVWSGKNEPVDF